MGLRWDLVVMRTGVGVGVVGRGGVAEGVGATMEITVASGTLQALSLQGKQRWQDASMRRGKRRLGASLLRCTWARLRCRLMTMG